MNIKEISNNELLSAYEEIILVSTEILVSVNAYENVNNQLILISNEILNRMNKN